MNSPSEIARIYVDVGFGKARLPRWKMFVLGIFAGAFIAFGAAGSSIASCGVQPAALGRVLSALVFPIGLMLVLCAGGELFTGNSLLLVPLIEKRITVSWMLSNWITVYLGNFVGSLLISLAVVGSHTLGLYGGELAKLAVNTAVTKVSLPLSDVIIRGILCNIMVCLAVWVAFAAKDLVSKIVALYLPVFLFVLCGFEHCIANMYFVPTGIFASYMYGIPFTPEVVRGTVTSLTGIPLESFAWLAFLFNNLVPATIGNIIGGALAVGGGYWYVYLQDSN